MYENTPSSVSCAFCERQIVQPVTAANANAEPVHESCLVNAMVSEMGRIETRERPEHDARIPSPSVE